MSQPRIGVGVLIFRDGKLLLGKRKGSHGAGHWSAPGGHLEFGETPQQCAARETQEECGLVTGECIAGPFTNDLFQAEQKHYVTLFMLAYHASGTPQRGWMRRGWPRTPSASEGRSGLTDPPVSAVN